jgi:hypothetical protein
MRETLYTPQTRGDNAALKINFEDTDAETGTVA